MISHLLASTSKLNTIFLGPFLYTMPVFLQICLDLLNLVTHELLVFTWVSNPVQGHFAVKPPVLCCQGNFCKAEDMFARRFTTMCPDTNLRRASINPFFTSLARAVTSPWLMPVPVQLWHTLQLLCPSHQHH